MTACLLALLLTPTSLDRPATECAADLLHREDVQTELKMTPAQLKRWSEMDRLPQARSTGTFAPDEVVVLDPAELDRKNAGREEKAWALLGPDQTVRLMELVVQRLGPLVLLRSDLQQRLELTEAQGSEVRRAKAKHDLATRALMRRAATERGEFGRLDPKRQADYLVRIDKELSDELDKVPTQDQRNALAEMAGKKFVFLERVFK